MTFKMRNGNRKELAKRVSEITGIQSRYMGVPSCAYQIGRYTVTKDGNLTVDDIAADPELIEQLISEELIEAETAGETVDEETLEQPEQTEPDEPAALHISVPMDKHSGTSLRNLLNLIYSRGRLISKAAQAEFSVEEGLIEKLKDDSCTASVESLMRTVADYEDQNGRSISGLTMTPDEITFTGFALKDADHADAYTKLISKMNEQALTQKRIQAKTVDDSNEKYSFYTWMTRIGMKGGEYKRARKILIENLDGHCAFKTQEDADKFSAKMKAKRDAEKAAKIAAEMAAEEAGATVGETETAED